jgi:hypothetical protein
LHKIADDPVRGDNQIKRNGILVGINYLDIIVMLCVEVGCALMHAPLPLTSSSPSYPKC